MEKSEIIEMAEGLMLDNDLFGWRFRFSVSKNRLGSCNHTQKEIILSAPISEINEVDSVKNTILHEIAHALVGGGQGHNYIWQQVCEEIGGIPERLSSNHIRVKGKYRYICPKCGYIREMYKKSRVKRACGECCKKYNNGKFSLDYLLVEMGLDSSNQRKEVICMAKNRKEMGTPEGENSEAKEKTKPNTKTIGEYGYVIVNINHQHFKQLGLKTEMNISEASKIIKEMLKLPLDVARARLSPEDKFERQINKMSDEEKKKLLEHATELLEEVNRAKK